MSVAVLFTQIAWITANIERQKVKHGMIDLSHQTEFRLKFEELVFTFLDVTQKN